MHKTYISFVERIQSFELNTNIYLQMIPKLINNECLQRLRSMYKILFVTKENFLVEIKYLYSIFTEKLKLRNKELFPTL